MIFLKTAKSGRSMKEKARGTIGVLFRKINRMLVFVCSDRKYSAFSEYNAYGNI